MNHTKSMYSSKTDIKKWFEDRVLVAELALSDESIFESLVASAEAINKSFSEGGKLLIFGNGGSAAEAQHFAAELTGRFEKKRKAIPAIALTTDTSFITAQSNDESFDTIFSRQIEALGKKGDVAFGMTTSDAYDGHSTNILKGFEAARANGLVTIGLFSKKTKNLLSLTDISIIAPHEKTDIIQEFHLAAIHMLCRLIEGEY